MKKILCPRGRKGKGDGRAKWERLLSEANELRHVAAKYELPGLHFEADQRLEQMFRAYAGEETVTRCPQCGALAVRDRPELHLGDAKCPECETFFTSLEARAGVS